MALKTTSSQNWYWKPFSKLVAETIPFTSIGNRSQNWYRKPLSAETAVGNRSKPKHVSETGVRIDIETVLSLLRTGIKKPVSKLVSEVVLSRNWHRKPVSNWKPRFLVHIAEVDALRSGLPSRAFLPAPEVAHWVYSVHADSGTQGTEDGRWVTATLTLKSRHISTAACAQSDSIYSHTWAGEAS